MLLWHRSLCIIHRAAICAIIELASLRILMRDPQATLCCRYGRRSMAGNRALYDRAMEQSREAARQKNWEEALKQAVRALQEFPQDADGRSSAAVALFNTVKYPQTLQILEELRGSDQNNPFFLE